VYGSVRSCAIFSLGSTASCTFPEEVIDDAFKQIPLSWINGDTDALESLLEKLLTRRKRVPDLIEASWKSRTNIFPNWT
jgi:hypothetical protein